jgi:hypothetical protein
MPIMIVPSRGSLGGVDKGEVNDVRRDETRGRFEQRNGNVDVELAFTRYKTGRIKWAGSWRNEIDGDLITTATMST